MSAVMTFEPQRHRISVDDYHRMSEAGILAEDSRVELIQGEIFDMPPMSCEHAGTVAMLDEMFQFAVRGRAAVHCQLPVHLDNYSEPVPDLMVLRRRDDFYRGHRATAEDVLLLIEVSHSSARFDLRVKAPLYAGHAVREAWVIDLKKRRMHVFHSPTAAGYERVDIVASPGVVSLRALPEVSVDLSRLFELD